MTMGDRLVVMNQGRIQQVDTPQNLYDNPVNKFVAGFIGSPPMNFIDCSVATEGENILLKTGTMALQVPRSKASHLAPYAGKEVIMGLRPEHILDHASAEDRERGTTFFASVWMVEPLGSEKLIHLRCGDTTLVVRSLSQAPMRGGEKQEFTAQMDRAYIFNKDTEKLVFTS
jgi:multiple sugar transport system ATP-binding protein